MFQPAWSYRLDESHHNSSQLIADPKISTTSFLGRLLFEGLNVAHYSNPRTKVSRQNLVSVAEGHKISIFSLYHPSQSFFNGISISSSSSRKTEDTDNKTTATSIILPGDSLILSLNISALHYC